MFLVGHKIMYSLTHGCSARDVPDDASANRSGISREMASSLQPNVSTGDLLRTVVCSSFLVYRAPDFWVFGRWTERRKLGTRASFAYQRD